MINQFKEYYSKTYIKLEIVKLLKFKELALLPHKEKIPEFSKKAYAVRNLTAGSLDFLNQNYSAYDISNRPYRMYLSLATFKQSEQPVFTYHPTKRKEQQKKFIKNFMLNPNNYVESYDFAIDLDEEKFKDGYKQATKIKNIFDEYNLPYILKPSGGKDGGFHFRIQGQHFSREITTPTQMVKLTYWINKELADIEYLPAIDLSLFDIRRIFGCPYSLRYNKAGWRVSLPLTDKQFENYTPEDIELTNVMKNVVMKNRGLCIHNQGKTPKIKEFVKEYYYPDTAEKSK